MLNACPTLSWKDKSFRPRSLSTIRAGNRPDVRAVLVMVEENDGGALRVRSEGERARERGLRGANGSEGGGGCGRALLVADRDASTLPHARHAAARLCRRTTAARSGRPRTDAARARARGRGRGRHGRAGPASASGPEVRPRPASAPFSLFYFFLNFFSQILL